MPCTLIALLFITYYSFILLLFFFRPISIPLFEGVTALLDIYSPSSSLPLPEAVVFWAKESCVEIFFRINRCRICLTPGVTKLSDNYNEQFTI